ncbi:hypothetical protein CEUSTIGMA_g11453.t1 [Chlamydomonas eustigma]|uniref:HIT-type domain-containing protein n=1 Tax=Chlamydomonas eustigma TaxID=1157962 RepID=A0A250XM81_9CHLO|nr:hypothetical protein CEUSTIGMA_g11453.t1 [Chlamydomonas eustigma]|eukprot:GAX84029.1 hypothetical protein CEUSTIGMA_g11453.t1 [Chlamydomonas eustigma]
MDGRRTLRARKVSQQMAIVDESQRQQATQARLDALENDHDAGDDQAADSAGDEEVIIHDDEDENDDEDGPSSSKKSKRGRKQSGVGAGPKKKFRGGPVTARGPKSFNRLLEDYILDKGAQQGSVQPPSGVGPVPDYLSIAAGPPTIFAPKKLCSVCGNSSMYTCSRCRSKYCSRKCHGVHVETRCLKFTL